MRIHFSLLLTIIALSAYGQSVYAPLIPEYNHFIDRQEILSGSTSSELHTSFKPYTREAVYKMTKKTDKDTVRKFSKVDKFNQGYLKDDNWEWSDSADKEGNSKKPLFKHFYKKKNAAFSFRDPDFEIQANPVFYFMGGQERDGSGLDYIDTRGAEVRGMLNKKIGFYSVVTTTQAVYPNYVRARINTPGDHYVPGEGYYKQYGPNGVDFFSARGYITFKLLKSTTVQFGQDKNFIGNGHRSLILSDFSSPCLFLKLQTKIWKINYTNLYTQMFYNTNTGRYMTYPRKFMSLHHFSLNVGKHLNIGLFESIIYTRQNNQYDLNYLNPVIFYRYVETYMGSSDKATVGGDFKLNFLKHLSMYGQLVLNEFRIHDITNGTGWWGNKQAFQLGLKYINVGGINNFDLQFETNVVRPYTYSSVSGADNYSNYNQPLADPMGANFVEFIGIMRCQPQKRVTVVGKAFATRIGLDNPSSNIDYGSNISIPYTYAITQRPYGNYIGQGVATNIIYTELVISYMVRHNLFIDLNALVRRQNAVDNDPKFHLSTYFGSLGFRYNLAQRTQEF